MEGYMKMKLGKNNLPIKEQPELNGSSLSPLEDGELSPQNNTHDNKNDCITTKFYKINHCNNFFIFF